MSQTAAHLVDHVIPHVPVRQWFLPFRFRCACCGCLIADQSPAPDVMTIDICVMDAAWPQSVRKQVIENVLACLAKACGVLRPSST